MRQNLVKGEYSISLSQKVGRLDLVDVFIARRQISQVTGYEIYRLFVDETDTGWELVEEGTEIDPSFTLPTRVLEMITEMMSDEPPELQSNDSARLDKLLTAVLDGTLRYHE